MMISKILNNFIDRLFRRTEAPSHPLREMTLADIDNLLGCSELPHLAKPAVLLCPAIAMETLGVGESKFGGVGMTDQEELTCPNCEEPLKLALQVFKRDNILDFIPEGYDLFEVHRCTNGSCQNEATYAADRTTVVRFNTLQPDSTSAPLRQVIPECTIHAVTVLDYPEWQEYPNTLNDELNLYDPASDDITERANELYFPRSGTKFGGYPAWIQSPFYPQCDCCGETMKFFFQLSSDEAKDAKRNYGFDEGWSPHGIMIGDLGNLYAYRCDQCDSVDIKTYWDCA